MNGNKKYKLVKDKASGLYSIVALRDFGNVSKGNVGGLIESERNLSHEGICWIYGNARVCGEAKVYGNARVCGEAKVYGNAKVFGDSWVYGEAYICGDAWVYGEAQIFDKAYVYGDVRIYGEARVYGNARAYDDTKIYGSARIYGDAQVYDSSQIFGNVEVCGEAKICGDAKIESVSDYMVFKNSWSSGRWFTWTRSNNMWKVGCFYGTGNELVAKAEKDSPLSGKCYAAAVNFVKTVSNAK